MSEKILGVLGGMGPAASAEFLKILAEKYPASKDQDHPVIYMISDPKIPDRGSAIAGEGEDPEPYIRKDMEKLIGCGADILAVPGNTAHYFIDRFRDEIKVPVAHIIEATVDASIKSSPEGAWMISTIGTARSGLYQKVAADRNYRLVVPPEEVQNKIHESIICVKSGNMEMAARFIEDAAQSCPLHIMHLTFQRIKIFQALMLLPMPALISLLNKFNIAEPFTDMWLSDHNV